MKPIGFLILFIGSACSTGRAAESAPTIPLCSGLTIVTAVNQIDGDYESIKTIDVVGPKEVRMKYSAETKGGMLDTEPLKKVNVNRTMLSRDLVSAKIYEQTFLEKSEQTIPGATSIGVSAEILRALKSRGVADLSISNAYTGLELTADRNKFPNYYSYLQAGTIRRTGAANLSVLVNDKLVELPAIRAEGDFVGDKAEFFFLDDERNPLTLAFRLGIGGIKPLDAEWLKLCDSMRKSGVSLASVPSATRCEHPNGGDRDTLRVIKITYRCAAPPALTAGASGAGAGRLPTGGADAGARVLEQALSAPAGKVDVYSIYFSFNSDSIREESAPTLKEIADILRRHSDWNLRIGGHTDGIGGDQYNLDLSKRRAAAVKDALSTRYGIQPARLTTAGFGKSQPKDTNDTLEGRARNRRVELARM